MAVDPKTSQKAVSVLGKIAETQGISALLLLIIVALVGWLGNKALDQNATNLAISKAYAETSAEAVKEQAGLIRDVATVLKELQAQSKKGDGAISQNMQEHARFDVELRLAREQRDRMTDLLTRVTMLLEELLDRTDEKRGDSAIIGSDPTEVELNG